VQGRGHDFEIQWQTRRASPDKSDGDRRVLSRERRLIEHDGTASRAARAEVLSTGPASTAEEVRRQADIGANLVAIGTSRHAKHQRNRARNGQQYPLACISRGGHELTSRFPLLFQISGRKSCAFRIMSGNDAMFSSPRVVDIGRFWYVIQPRGHSSSMVIGLFGQRL
jgi:hypothetical protein